MFGLNKLARQQKDNQVDPEVTKIMGLPPDEAAPRMSSGTPEPVIVNDPTQTMAGGSNDDLSSKKSDGILKKIFTSWRH